MHNFSAALIPERIPARRTIKGAIQNARLRGVLRSIWMAIRAATRTRVYLMKLPGIGSRGRPPGGF